MTLKDELYKIWADSGAWRDYNFYDWLEVLLKHLKEQELSTNETCITNKISYNITMTTNKQEIKNRLEELSRQGNFELDLLKELKEKSDRALERATEINIEVKQLQIALAKLEEIEEQHEKNPRSRFANMPTGNDERPLHQIKNEELQK